MKIWKKSSGYSRLRVYSDAIVRLSFSSISIEGIENIPRDGMVMFAPNHCCSLMDAMLVLLLRPHLPIGFGARSDIFRKPGTARLLRWLRILPVARERNGRQEVAKNYETFDEAIDCMDHGVPFCMYPEGRHRPERGMMPVRKGIFRVARMAMERTGKTVYVVPVAEDYEYFFRQCGKVSLRVGEPLNVNDYIETHRGLPEIEVNKGLCETIQSRIESMLGGNIPRSEKRRAAIAEGKPFEEPPVADVVMRSLSAVMLSPLALALTAASLPIWLPSRIILAGMRDKAWSHTVYFAFRVIFPVFAPFEWLRGVIFNFYNELFCDLFR